MVWNIWMGVAFNTWASELAALEAIDSDEESDIEDEEDLLLPVKLDRLSKEHIVVGCADPKGAAMYHLFKDGEAKATDGGSMVHIAALPTCTQACAAHPHAFAARPRWRGAGCRHHRRSRCWCR
mgnify:CR=1 FL=1